MHSIRPGEHHKGLLLLNSIPPAPFNIVHPKNKRIIATVNKDTITITDVNLKKRISIQGICIPPFLRDRFKGRSGIFPADEFFYQAFITAECWDFLRAGYKIEKIEEIDQNFTPPPVD